MDFNIGSALWFASRGYGNWINRNSITEKAQQIISIQQSDSEPNEMKEVWSPERIISHSSETDLNGREKTNKCSICTKKVGKIGCPFQACRSCCVGLCWELYQITQEREIEVYKVWNNPELIDQLHVDFKFWLSRQTVEHVISQSCESKTESCLERVDQSQNVQRICRAHARDFSRFLREEGEIEISKVCENTEEIVDRVSIPNYTCEARVVIVGIGADEYLGGYDLF